MSRPRVVVTGLGMISAVGCGNETFWNAVVRGESGISTIGGFDASEFKYHHAGEIADFDARKYIKSKSIKFLDRITRLALAASTLALEDAGLEIDSLNKTRIGVTFGTMYSGWESLASFENEMADDKKKKTSPMLFQNIAAHSPASRINLEFGFKGLCSAIVSGFCSGSDSIGWGCEYIRSRKTDLVLAGGAEELNRWIYGTFQIEDHRAPLSTRIGEACMPFDANRKGFVPGEGACFLVLEEFEAASKRGARIYAELAGYGATHSAQSLGDYAMTGSGAADAIELALEDSDVRSDEIAYICAEGNGTVPGDLYESRAIHRAYPQTAQKIPISSIKPVIGHTFGASGAFNAATCCLAIRNQVAPPTINSISPDPLCDLNQITGNARELRMESAISHSFSPGGNNSILVFKLV